MIDLNFQRPYWSKNKRGKRIVTSAYEEYGMDYGEEGYYTVTENGVEFKVYSTYVSKTCVDDSEDDICIGYRLNIVYKGVYLMSLTVSCFEEGFELANMWATRYLYKPQCLEDLIREDKEHIYIKHEECEIVDDMKTAKSIVFPPNCKYSGYNIYDRMCKDLEHCVIYYVGNLSEEDFEFDELGVSKLNYRESSQRVISYNCIEFLLKNLWPQVYGDLLGYFIDVNEDDMDTTRFPNEKYKHKTLDEVYDIDLGYVRWYYNNAERNIYNIRLINIMDAVLN